MTARFWLSPPTPRRAGFVSGGDDGAFRRIAADGSVTDIARFGMKWVEHVASFADPKGKGGLLACAVGKLVHLFDAAGQKLKELTHPSAVTGLAFDAKGKRIGASHYNGASLWFVAAKTDTPAQAGMERQPHRHRHPSRTARRWSPRCRRTRCTAGACPTASTCA